ncbi:MAG: uroporphyrinogen-III synthase [Bdellovibrionota bacterium]
MNQPRVIITRSATQESSSRKLCDELGIHPLIYPSIEYQSLMDQEKISKLLVALSSIDYVLVTSQNALHFFFDAIKNSTKSFPIHIRWIVLGKTTKHVLEDYGHQAYFFDSSFQTSAQLAKHLLGCKELSRKSILILRPKESVSDFSTWLKPLTRNIYEQVLYQTQSSGDGKARFNEDFPIDCDWISFLSPSAVEAFFAFKKNDEIAHWIFNRGIKIASIGPTTTQKIAEFEVPVSIESPDSTFRSLLQEIKNFD